LQIDISLTNQAGQKVSINTAPNSWVHKSQGTRIFYATGNAYLPSATPAALQQRRQAELEEIKVCSLFVPADDAMTVLHFHRFPACSSL
jgi:hypothetical protein